MEDEDVTLRDYTEAFKVRKSLRKIGKANIPLKEGLFVDDLKVFGITLVLWILTYTMVLAPPVKVIARFFGHRAPTGIPYLFLVFVPPILAAVASRRPVRHNLGVFGLLRAVWRDLTDDPVHRKGVPVRKGNGADAYRIVLWRPRPELLPALTASRPLPNGFATRAPLRRGAVPAPHAEPVVEHVPDRPVVDLTKNRDDDLTGDYVISTRRP